MSSSRVNRKVTLFDGAKIRSKSRVLAERIDNSRVFLAIYFGENDEDGE